MSVYHVKQKFKLGGEAFTIKDAYGQVAYQVKGSFLKLPKTFDIFDGNGQVISRLSKSILTLLPRFEVVLFSGASFTIQKQLTFLRDRYRIEGLGLVVDGNIWDLSFALKDDFGQVVAQIDKRIFHLTSTYEVDIRQDKYTDLVISLVVAIDYVEMLENSSK